MNIKQVNGLQEEQQITWRCELNGGYGRVIFVKAKVIRLNPKRCRIEAQLANGGVSQVNVDYRNIKESTIYQKMLVNSGKEI